MLLTTADRATHFSQAIIAFRLLDDLCESKFVEHFYIAMHDKHMHS